MTRGDDRVEEKDVPAKVIEVLGWIKIFMAPVFLGLFIGGCMYIFSSNLWVKISGVSIFIAGIIGGVVLANYTKASGGSQKSTPQLSDSPDWDEMAQKMRDQEKNG
jgi:hypothetical protein